MGAAWASLTTAQPRPPPCPHEQGMPSARPAVPRVPPRPFAPSAVPPRRGGRRRVAAPVPGARLQRFLCTASHGLAADGDRVGKPAAARRDCYPARARAVPRRDGTMDTDIRIAGLGPRPAAAWAVPRCPHPRLPPPQSHGRAPTGRRRPSLAAIAGRTPRPVTCPGRRGFAASGSLATGGAGLGVALRRRDPLAPGQAAAPRRRTAGRAPHAALRRGITCPPPR